MSEQETNFISDLRTVLNRYSAESPSGTPDFILATMLTGVLREFNEAVSRRAEWRGETCELPALTAAAGVASSASAPANEYGDAEESEAEYKDHAATVTSEPTDAQVERIATAMHGDQCPDDPDPGKYCGCDGDHYRRLARIAAGISRPVIDREKLIKLYWVTWNAHARRKRRGGPQFAEVFADAVIAHVGADTGGQEQ